MQQIKHWDILLRNQVAKKEFINKILNGHADGELEHFNTKKGILFSDLAIEHFIEKEYQYDSVEAAPETSRQLRTFSSGERKKAFLKYCINQNPDFIILDNLMDHLDLHSRKVLHIQLEELGKNITLIQIINRSTDLLPFISNKRQINDNSFVLNSLDSISNTRTFSLKAVPKPITTIEYTDTVLIQMNNLKVSYDEKPILNNINWTIKKGEFWQLIGPNGSGKSTILSLITGDNPKGYGQDLYLFGKKKGSGESIWDIKKNIGQFSTAMMDLFQKNHTVEQMILSGFFDSIGLYIQPSTLQIKLMHEWLDFLNMNHLKKTVFINLSVGQQRAIMIIRAVLKNPPLLILDEPTEGLDDENVVLVTQLIAHLAKETNIAIIFVSHRIEAILAPNSILELTPKPTGSEGKIKIQN
ncbi:ATP-binding cassette domain-containing protein [Flavobacterium galactosidilyticum]|uniref:ATP-binding cassette domain-containing protein n=1 Tax=Flavobacterium galactosidilyticum TaxID=2893886 RepID=UPI001E2D4F38|nr:ATP-binding cassette domain-containing protein [Flavobacterium sp. F-340]UFH45951.1 ATP-binding cassette domain-containing protein [Flavobacterium sp. F-340]